jgi:hypothetical protein
MVAGLHDSDVRFPYFCSTLTTVSESFRLVLNAGQYKNKKSALLRHKQCRFSVSAFRKNLSKKLKKAYKKYLPVHGRFWHWMGRIVMTNLLKLLLAVPFGKLGGFKHGSNFRLYRNLQNL